MDTLKALSAGVAFLLELAMHAALSYWGFQGEKSVCVRWSLGIGIPLVVAVLWGKFLAPKATQLCWLLTHPPRFER